ncbi:mitochondrial S-adenosylmethionine carrier protein-like isoform X1 [Halichondria panicea]|uniref:mitochondrial S-adenosylmethionine carrier protein-like isoform X1 n=1 Tax=Halichondria panicea TaxID=6063 RepID=UPI00312BAD97
MDESFFATFTVPLIAGAAAGTTSDAVLFPMDTIKTRFQSSKGFLRAGGFHRMYAGILPTVLGSAPSGATFFCTYELTKTLIGQFLPNVHAPFMHMLGATAGEIVSDIARVPFELVKQRLQANCHLKASFVVRNILATEGLRGLFRGYFSTVTRDIPFSFIQYPLWEHLKSLWAARQGGPTEPWQGAVCGSVAGCTAAVITTPLDVAKTRIMLADAKGVEVTSSLPQLIVTIGRNEGITSLFSGIVPRMIWIGIGGFTFLGTYDFVKHHLLAFEISRYP